VNCVKKRLTARQREILNYLEERIALQGFPPSLQETAARFGVACSTVAYHLEALRRKGRLSRNARARSITLREPPRLCSKNCPRLIRPEDDAEQNASPGVFAPDDVLALCDPGRLVAFTLDDDSMFDLGIHCGDTVLAVPVEEKKPAPGDIVLAQRSDGKKIVRSYFPFNSSCFDLVPAGSDFFESERFPANSRIILGVVVLLTRRF
jgi:repressor LexA